MTLFANGKTYRVAIRREPPPSYSVPFIELEIALPNQNFIRIVGKVDTGASYTVLTAATAGLLGIQDIKKNYKEEKKPNSATGHKISCYTHRIYVRPGYIKNHPLQFTACTAFSEDITRDLFGMDWLSRYYTAVDPHCVYFLSD